MCGRFSLTEENTNAIKKRFAVDITEVDWTPRYNLAPKQQALSIFVKEDNLRHLVSMEWGLIPSWSKDEKFMTINARVESLDTKPMFKNIFTKKRCIIPADGFYEWIHKGKKKIPYRILRKDEELFGFAALWDTHCEKNTFTLITTEANTLMQKIHTRMPVILSPKDEELWLDSTFNDPSDLKNLLTPYNPSLLQYYEVSPIVNSWKNDTPDCTQPV